MKATRDRRDPGARFPERRVTRRDLIARALALGCSATAVAGVLAACRRAGPTATAPRPGIAPPAAGSPAAPAPAPPAAPLGTPSPIPAAGVAWLRD